MFNDLRDFSDEPLYEDEASDLFKDPEGVETPAVEAEASARKAKKKRRNKNFLGMTAQQRFILSVMVMLTVCMVGTLAMFVLGKMSI